MGALFQPERMGDCSSGKYLTLSRHPGESCPTRYIHWLCFPTAVEFDPGSDSVIIADSQRNRLQVYKKVRNYSDFQANL